MRKLDQVLNITPDDVDTLATKATIAQAEGDLPARLGAPRSAAAKRRRLQCVWKHKFTKQSWSAVLHKLSLRLKEILAKPDPALGYINSKLRFWLGWAQEVAGDHAAAEETWRQARSELESFLKEQPENYRLIGDLALTYVGLGDKVAAFKLVEQAMAAVPIEKDALAGPIPIEILARVAAQIGIPIAPSPLYRNSSRYHTGHRWLRTCRLLLHCSASIQCSIRSERTRASRNSVRKRSREPV